MRNVGYTSHHSVLWAVIYGKICNFVGKSNKPVKQNIRLKPTYETAVGKIESFAAGKSAFTLTSFTPQIFKNEFIANIIR